MSAESSTAINAAGQWLSLMGMVEAVSAGHNIDRVEAKQLLADSMVHCLRPVLIERSGIAVVVTDPHDRAFDNVIRASLLMSHDEFSRDDLIAAAYSEIDFTVGAAVAFIKSRQLTVADKMLKEWEGWQEAIEPLLRARGLLYESAVKVVTLDETTLTSTGVESDGDQLMTIEQVCSMLQIGRTLFDKKVKNHLEVLDMGHRTIRITRASVVAYINLNSSGTEIPIIQTNNERSEWQRKRKSTSREVIQVKGLSGGTTLGTSTNASTDAEFAKVLAQMKGQ